ncbi:hypothetical protein [Delftia acidovorans]|uniref:Uncharacterized protein n=1 Tax=Delftia acidovorans TaxID=80866 RepID=A0AAJ2VGD6_DELAC|nr:hypothetical protein [Delftia acidovorans]MDX4957882.1 hypothetical protein [Delftia acidovorans]
MQKSFVLILAALFTGVCSAAQLKADSLLCEGEDSLLEPVKRAWRDLSGSGALKTASASIEFSKSMARSQQILGDLAVTEEGIRRDARRMHGSNLVQQSDAASERQKNEQDLAVYQKIQMTCAASVEAPTDVVIIERKPISGLAKVRLTISGSPAEVWTYARNVTP